MFQAVTNDITIQVEPSYVKDQSDPRQSYFFFSYKVRISNGGKAAVQLVSRHWIITDGFGQVEEVVGPGVVGQQPKLEPGEKFEYSSFCPLNTPTGSMQGTYKMVNMRGEEFEVTIPKFILCEPNHYN